jgi:hypothetical protein
MSERTVIGYTEPVTGKQIEVEVRDGRVREPRSEHERSVFASFDRTGILKPPRAARKAAAKKATTAKRRAPAKARKVRSKRAVKAAPRSEPAAPLPKLAETSGEG